MGERERVGATVHRYAEDVVEGRIVAGPGVRAACRRHFHDLDAGDWYFSEARAGRLIQFFELFLCHYRGDWAGKPFLLDPWQRFVQGSIFGWLVEPDDRAARRFTNAYLEIGKGNGKSPIAAGTGLYGLVGDDEAAAEIYPAATTRQQAGIIFRDARAMAENSPEIRKRLRILTHSLEHEPSRSFLHAVSAEAGTLSGPRPHMNLIDEIHEHRTNEVIEKLEAGIKNRRQPLTFEITNSGQSQATVCWEHREHSLRVADPEATVKDPRWFGFVCGLDEDDQKEGAWENEACWPKANPGLGSILPIEYLRGQVRKAKGIPSKVALVKRLNFCIWTTGVDHRWVDLAAWRGGACGISLDALEGRECYAGLDLSSTTDLASLALVFPPEDAAATGPYVVLSYNWVAQSELWVRRYQRGVPYHAWVQGGHLVECSGPIIDDEMIFDQVLDAHRRFDLREVAVDEWNSAQLVRKLQEEGVVAYPMRQGFKSFAGPMRESERLITGGLVEHDGNPVMDWALENMAVSTDPAGNRKPNKEKSSDRIDPAVAMIMAIGRAVTRAEPEEEFFSFGAMG